MGDLMYDTKALPALRDAFAPDGSDVRLLLSLRGGGVAHFELAAGATSVAVRHRTVEEIWYFVGGEGQMWRSATADSAAASTDSMMPAQTAAPAPRFACKAPRIVAKAPPKISVTCSSRNWF